MAQLFSNLLSNALTYGSEDQPVRVRAVSDEEAFELAVANAGEPIPPATLSRIFEPFYRSGSEHSREGLGLGLYIAVKSRRLMAERSLLSLRQKRLASPSACR